MDPPDGSEELTRSALATRAGVTDDEIQRLIEHGIVVPRDTDPPFGNVDILKIRVARACEEGGLPISGMAEAIRRGLLSFAFVDTWPFEREGGEGHQTHAELAAEVGLPLDTLQQTLEAFGFTRCRPEDVVLEPERPIAQLLGVAFARGILDLRGALRFGTAHADAMRRVAAVQTEAYHSGVEMPLLRSGASQGEVMGLAGRKTAPITGCWTPPSSPRTGASRS